MRSSISCIAVFAVALAGCPSQAEQPRFDSGPGTHDSGTDAASTADTGRDASNDAASAQDAPTVDGGPDAPADLDSNVPDAGIDANVVDANVGDANVVDANVGDANRPDGGNACVNAGGRCVALVPSACPAPGHVGDATMYSCGPGLGTECCLPAATSTAPVCMNVGTAQEGWYQPDGTVICVLGTTPGCAGITARCQHVGTAQQGWYATSGHGCPPLVTEIVHDAACM
jgi:hypothetical protein